MNQEIKTKWVAALRSGHYAQTKNNLKDKDRYCCLGVLCEISKLETGFGIVENLKETDTDENIGPTIQRWAGLTNAEGNEVTINGRHKALANHNDEGCTFLQIADAIESQL